MAFNDQTPAGQRVNDRRPAGPAWLQEGRWSRQSGWMRWPWQVAKYVDQSAFAVCEGRLLPNEWRDDTSVKRKKRENPLAVGEIKKCPDQRAPLTTSEPSAAGNAGQQPLNVLAWNGLIARTLEADDQLSKVPVATHLNFAIVSFGQNYARRNKR
ncbi:TPA: hypothetical protein QEM39_002963 [Pseudomonas putida]|nr:hypothetical protein [Pseudomonas putida]